MPLKTKAVVFRQTGGPEVLEYEEVELPDPGPGEVRLRHTAIGLNFADIYARTGHSPVPLPGVIGSEAAGVVEAVGDGVDHVKVGDRVCYGGGGSGAYARHRNILARRLLKTPSGISDETAAASLVKGMTVEYLLTRCYPIKKGELGLFYAAAGGVGSIAGQWARYLGARLIGVAAGEAKCRQALESGYAHVIDRTKEDIAAKVKEIAGGGVSVAYDSVGSRTFDTTLKCLAPRGMFVSFGATTGPVPSIAAETLQKMGSLYFTRPTLATYAATPGDMAASSGALFKLILEDLIRIKINARYKLEDAARAHRDLEKGATVGSSILIP